MAVEFGALAAMAALSIGQRPISGAEVVDWGNVVATLCVEFCAAHSLVAGRRAGAAVDRTLRDGATALALGRLADVAVPPEDASCGSGRAATKPDAADARRSPSSFADLLYEQLVVVPAKVGALAAGLGRDEVGAIERWGHAVARTAMVVDARRLRAGRPSRFGMDLGDSLAKGIMPTALVDGTDGASHEATRDRTRFGFRPADTWSALFPNDVRRVLSVLGTAAAHAQGYGAFDRLVERDEAVTR